MLMNGPVKEELVKSRIWGSDIQARNCDRGRSPGASMPILAQEAISCGVMKVKSANVKFS